MSWLRARVSGVGLTDTQSLAVACGIPLAHLLSWGSGDEHRRPSVPEFLRVAAMLEVDPYDLLVAAGWVDPTVS